MVLITLTTLITLITLIILTTLITLITLMTLMTLIIKIVLIRQPHPHHHRHQHQHSRYAETWDKVKHGAAARYAWNIDLTPGNWAQTQVDELVQTVGPNSDVVVATIGKLLALRSNVAHLQKRVRDEIEALVMTNFDQWAAEFVAADGGADVGNVPQEDVCLTSPFGVELCQVILNGNAKDVGKVITVLHDGLDLAHKKVVFCVAEWDPMRKHFVVNPHETYPELREDEDIPLDHTVIMIGHSTSPQHFFSLEPLLGAHSEHWQPTFRFKVGVEARHTGETVVVGHGGRARGHFKAVDKGMYPWGDTGKSRDIVDQYLRRICDFVGVSSKHSIAGNPIGNCCGYVAPAAGLLSSGVVAVEAFLAKLSSSGLPNSGLPTCLAAVSAWGQQEALAIERAVHCGSPAVVLEVARQTIITPPKPKQQKKAPRSKSKKKKHAVNNKLKPKEDVRMSDGESTSEADEGEDEEDSASDEASEKEEHEAQSQEQESDEEPSQQLSFGEVHLVPWPAVFWYCENKLPNCKGQMRNGACNKYNTASFVAAQHHQQNLPAEAFRQAIRDYTQRKGNIPKTSLYENQANKLEAVVVAHEHQVCRLSLLIWLHEICLTLMTKQNMYRMSWNTTSWSRARRYSLRKETVVCGAK
jgi:hypothetical protein